MSPLVPKHDRPWQVDPGHIHDAPEPSPMPDEQERLGVEIPPEEIEALQAAEEQREPRGEPAPVPEPAEVEVPEGLARQIRRVMKRYPRKRSAAIPALWAVQRRYGWCTPEGIQQAAAVMEVTPAYLESVASFYDLFRLEPMGTHEVLVCTNISCWLRGADRLLDSFKEAAGVDAGETSADGEFHVRRFECLGACDIAPMASIDERYYGPLTDDDAEAAVKQIRNRRRPLPEKRLEDRPLAGGPRASGDKRVARDPINKVPRPKSRAKTGSAKPKPVRKPRGKR